MKILLWENIYTCWCCQCTQHCSYRSTRLIHNYAHVTISDWLYTHTHIVEPVWTLFTTDPVDNRSAQTFPSRRWIRLWLVPCHDVQAKRVQPPGTNLIDYWMNGRHELLWKGPTPLCCAVQQPANISQVMCTITLCMQQVVNVVNACWIISIAN